MKKINEFDFMEEKEILDFAKPRNCNEKELLEILYKNLGEVTTIKKLCKFLNLSESHIYKALEERKLVAYKTGSKNLILTKTILNMVRSREE